jgi:hypothetical protein
VSSLIKLYNRFSGLWFFTFPYQLHGFVHLSQHLGRRRRSYANQPCFTSSFFISFRGTVFKSRVRFSVSFRFVLVGNNTDSVLRFSGLERPVLCHLPFFCDYQGLTLLCAYFKFYQFFSSVNYISILVYRRTRPEWLWLLRLRLRLGGRRVYILCGIWC